MSRATYSELFSVIGTAFGAGDGTTTFNVPDLRGRAVFGLDNMAGTAANRVTSGVSGIGGTTLGASGGSQSMQSHTHTATVSDPGHSHQMPTQVGFSASAGSSTFINSTQPPGVSTSGATTGITVSNASTGSGSSQNMPPALMANYIIKT